MPGLVPGIHVLGVSRKKDVDGRVKPGHDESAVLIRRPTAIGSMPLLTISGRAWGEARNLISALPASGSFDTLAMPAENTVIFCNESGRSR